MSTIPPVDRALPATPHADLVHERGRLERLPRERLVAPQGARGIGGHRVLPSIRALAFALVAICVVSASDVATARSTATEGAGSPGIVVSLRIVAGSLLHRADVEAMCREAERIWRRHGVRLACVAGRDDPVHLVVVVESSSAVTGHDKAAQEPGVAWSGTLARLRRVPQPYSRRPPAERPDAVIELSLSSTRRLVQIAFDGDPNRETWARVRVPVLLGRAVAHEVGHYLLESREHAAEGLMRALYRTVDAARNPDYGLSGGQRERLLALWARRAP